MDTLESNKETHTRIVKGIAKRIVERANSLQLVGKKRDDMALNYFIGAAACADMQDDKELSNLLALIASLVISIHGYNGVLELLTKETP